MLPLIRYAPLIAAGGLLLALAVYFALLRQPTGTDRSRQIARLVLAPWFAQLHR